MLYKFNASVLEYGYVEVEANSLEEAKDLVIEAEQNGKVTWNDREITDITEV